MKGNGNVYPVWHETIGASRRCWPALVGDIDADVVVIGAGITGLTTASW